LVAQPELVAIDGGAGWAIGIADGEVVRGVGGEAGDFDQFVVVGRPIFFQLTDGGLDGFFRARNCNRKETITTQKRHLRSAAVRLEA
jgi:hypothetical protein